MTSILTLEVAEGPAIIWFVFGLSCAKVRSMTCNSMDRSASVPSDTKRSSNESVRALVAAEALTLSDTLCVAPASRKNWLTSGKTASTPPDKPEIVNVSRVRSDVPSFSIKMVTEDSSPDCTTMRPSSGPCRLRLARGWTSNSKARV